MIKHRKINNKAICICGSAMIHKKGKGWVCPIAEDEKDCKVAMKYPLILTNENSDKIEVIEVWDFNCNVYRVNVRLKKSKKIYKYSVCE